ncbi:MAG: lipoprotein ABC transporter ATP-binding protein [Candidatus Phytoplasma cynodontis]|uniref:ABC transporter ATP-binding protein/permease n=1 Tax='Cynodon dactylon' phytoplasma TaxID=295320 RepID=UPI001265C841|nr:ABC transporter ATP-binding protein ['Cynodon dactylon' phytoplasma]KAB8121858.1 ABC transporter ATP-binding protein ['Cynodon dactylon' phytoplasma]WIA07817.1 MAG: lipoprotein ABC transporter ATP-binding protein [Candidatus Phytoplasma cynodontis]
MLKLENSKEFMFRLTNVNKKYNCKKNDITDALINFSINLPKKGFIFVLGKSGSGKTTLFNILSGIDTADSGDVWVAGKFLNKLSIKELDDYRNGMIDFIFQDFHFIEEINVLENIKLIFHLQNKKPDEKKIDSLFEELGLDKKIKYRKINELSGGQKQRISIIRALLKDSKIILADEPTNNLDNITGQKVYEKLKEESKKKLVIMITHDESKLCDYADQIIRMNNGILEQNLIRTQNNKFIPIVQIDKNFYPKNENEKEEIINSNKDFVSIPSSLNFKLFFKMAFSALMYKKFLLIIFIFAISFLTTVNLSLPIAMSYNDEKYFTLFEYFFKNINRIILDLTNFSASIDSNSQSTEIIDSIFGLSWKTQMFYFTFCFIIPASLIFIYFLIGIRFKRKEIGVLKILGVNNFTVIKIFLFECFLFSIILALLSNGIFYWIMSNFFVLNALTFKGNIDITKHLIPRVPYTPDMFKLLILFLSYSPFKRSLFCFLNVLTVHFFFSVICVSILLFFLYRKKTIDIIWKK